MMLRKFEATRSVSKLLSSQVELQNRLSSHQLERPQICAVGEFGARGQLPRITRGGRDETSPCAVQSHVSSSSSIITAFLLGSSKSKNSEDSENANADVPSGKIMPLRTNIFRISRTDFGRNYSAGARIRSSNRSGVRLLRTGGKNSDYIRQGVSLRSFYSS